VTFHIGITATRLGVTGPQAKAILDVLRYNAMTKDLVGLCMHQGCCVGGDEQITIMAATLGTIPIVAYPPTIKTYESKLAVALSSTIMADQDYLVRNQSIVDASDLLIVAPKGDRQRLRSGTWSTYRYAIKSNVETLVILPDGSYFKEK